MNNLSKLPPLAFHANTLHCRGPYGEPPVIAITRGEPGFHPIYTPLTADDLNRSKGVLRAQSQAMLAGSMFGWNVPAADPDNEMYANGHPNE